MERNQWWPDGGLKGSPRIIFRGDGTVLYLDCGGGDITLNVSKLTELYTGKSKFYYM